MAAAHTRALPQVRHPQLRMIMPSAFWRVGLAMERIRYFHDLPSGKRGIGSTARKGIGFAGLRKQSVSLGC